jgi:integrase
LATYPKGNKYITKFMVNGERHTKMHDTQAEGEAWELEARAALKLGKPMPQAEKKIGGSDAGKLGNLLRETATLHWSKGKDSSKCELNAATFVKWCGTEMSVSEAFKQDNIDDFIAYLVNEREVSGSTINRYCSAISVMAQRAIRKRDQLPTFPRYKESRGRFRFFSHEEETAVTNLWTVWERSLELDFFIFLIDTGARTYTEGTALKWDACHKDRVIFWETKNGGFRAVPLSDRARAILDRLRKTKGNQPGPFSELTKPYMRHLWENTRAQIPGLADAVLYCTRHTYGSRMVMNGVPLSVLKKLMGHSDIKMTERYAIFEDGAAFAHALAALNGAGFAPPKPQLTVVEGDLAKQGQG